MSHRDNHTDSTLMRPSRAPFPALVWPISLVREPLEVGRTDMPMSGTLGGGTWRWRFRFRTCGWNLPPVGGSSYVFLGAPAPWGATKEDEWLTAKRSRRTCATGGTRC